MHLSRFLSQRWLTSTLLASASLLSTTAVQADEPDFGEKTEQTLTAQSEKLFGFKNPLARPANPTDYVPRQNASAAQRVLLANGLKAEFVTRNVAVNGDMIALWPNATNPTHLAQVRHGSVDFQFF